METRQVRCPGCGGPIELANRFVKLAVCSWCAHTVHVTREGVSSGAPGEALVDWVPLLRVGITGTLRGRPFRAAGRVRFRYGDGWWDEWWLLFADGAQGWLHEDEGELELVRRQDDVEGLPAAASLSPGTRFTVGDLQVSVTERRNAVVEGAEGQVPLDVRIGEELVTVDATGQGRTVMLEYGRHGVELCLGEPVDIDEIELEEDEA